MIEHITDEMEPYFAGQKLYGDDFSAEQISVWYENEAEAYANLGAKHKESYTYGYHALNIYHGFSKLPRQKFRHVLGFGSAYGDELKPINQYAESVMIVDPSDAFAQKSIDGRTVRYLKPAPNGNLEIETANVDLVVCFGVLHHIPNVSAVMRELARVTRPGGFMLLREPIVAMGDWRRPRRGLTKNERGIPFHILKNISEASGFIVDDQSFCDCYLTPLLFSFFSSGPYNNDFAVRVDAIIARIFSWNLHYFPKNKLQKLCPASAYLLLRKSPDCVDFS